jgi:hypothetical protein
LEFLVLASATVRNSFPKKAAANIHRRAGLNGGCGSEIRLDLRRPRLATAEQVTPLMGSNKDICTTHSDLVDETVHDRRPGRYMAGFDV